MVTGYSCEPAGEDGDLGETVPVGLSINISSHTKPQKEQIALPIHLVSYVHLPEESRSVIANLFSCYQNFWGLTGNLFK